MSVYSVEIYVYGHGYPKLGVLHHGHHLVGNGDIRKMDDSGPNSTDRNEACRQAESLAGFLCSKLRGSRAAYYIADHWNQNLRTGFTR
jgi:hypothetical protein